MNINLNKLCKLGSHIALAIIVFHPKEDPVLCKDASLQSPFLYKILHSTLQFSMKQCSKPLSCTFPYCSWQLPVQSWNRVINPSAIARVLFILWHTPLSFTTQSLITMVEGYILLKFAILFLSNFVVFLELHKIHNIFHLQSEYYWVRAY